PPVIGDDEVRVAVEAYERRRLPHAVADASVNHDPALRSEVVGEEDLDLAESRGEDELAEEGIHRDAAAAPVLGVDVLVAGRIVELLRLGTHEGVVVAGLAVVDLGPGDPLAPRRDRRGGLYE